MIVINRGYFRVTKARGRHIVQGNKGELRASFASKEAANLDARRLNEAYRLGCQSMIGPSFGVSPTKSEGET